MTNSDYDYKRNHSFISTCTEASNVVTAITELPHDLDVGDQVIIKNVSSTTNTSATVNQGYNGTFLVTSVDNDKTFKYSTTDVDGVTHSVLDSLLMIQVVEQLHFLDLKEMIYRQTITSTEMIQFKNMRKIFLMVFIIYMF